MPGKDVNLTFTKAEFDQMQNELLQAKEQAYEYKIKVEKYDKDYPKLYQAYKRLDKKKKDWESLPKSKERIKIQQLQQERVSLKQVFDQKLKSLRETTKLVMDENKQLKTKMQELIQELNGVDHNNKGDFEGISTFFKEVIGSIKKNESIPPISIENKSINEQGDELINTINNLVKDVKNSKQQDDQLQSLKNQLQTSSSENETLKGELELMTQQLDSKTKTMEDEYNEGKNHIESLENEISDLKLQLEAETTKYSSTLEKLTSAEGKIKANAIENDELSKKLKDAIISQSNLEEKVVDLTEENSKLEARFEKEEKAQKDHFESQIESLQEEIQNLSSVKSDEATEKYKDLLREHNDLKSSFGEKGLGIEKEMNKLKDQLEQDKESFLKQIEKKDATIDSLKSDCHQHLESLEQANTENKELSSSLEKSNASHKKELIILQKEKEDEITKLKEESKSLSSKVEQLEASQFTIQKELTEKNTKLEEIQNEREEEKASSTKFEKHLQSEQEKLLMTLSETKAKLTDTEAQLVEMEQAQTNSMDEKVKSLENEITTINSHLSLWKNKANNAKEKEKAAKAEFRTSKSTIKSLEKQLAEIQLNSSNDQEKFQSLQLSNTQITEQLSSKEELVKRRDKKISKLSKQVEETTKLLKTRSEELLKLQDYLEELKPTLEKGKKFDDFQKQYDSLESKFISISDKYANVRASLDNAKEKLVIHNENKKALSNQLASLRTEIDQQRKAAIKSEKDISKSYDRKMNDMARSFDQKISDQSKSYENRMRDQAKSFEKQIDEQKNTFEKILSDTSKHHLTQIKAAKNENEEIVRGYRTAIEKIHANQDLQSENVEKQKKKLHHAHEQSLSDLAAKYKVTITTLNTKIAAKDNVIASLNEQLSNKDTVIEEERQKRQLIIFNYKENKAKMVERESLLKNQIEKYHATIRRYDRSASAYVSQFVASSIARAESRYYADRFSHLSSQLTSLQVRLDTHIVTVDRLRNDNTILEKRLKDTKVVAKSKLTKQATLIRDLQRQMKRAKKRSTQSTTSSVSSHSTNSSHMTSSSHRPPPSPSSSITSSSLRPPSSTPRRFSISSNDSNYSELPSTFDHLQRLERQNDRLLYQKGLLDAKVHQLKDQLQGVQKRVLDLEEDVEQKRTIIQYYIKRERAGRLSNPEQETQRAVIEKHKSNANSSGWSLFGRKSTSQSNAKGDLQSIQAQTQRVLEDMIHENLQLKKQLQLMGEEVDRLLKDKS